MNRNGFSLIEVMIGMLILVVGVLTLAASTGYVGTQLQASDLRTERGVAVQQAVERLHATEFESINPRAEGDAITIGNYSVWWNVTSLRWALKEVEVYSEGPGFSGGERQELVADTVIFRIARPVK